MIRILAVMMLVGCTADPADRPATWSYLHAAVIVPNCATSSCHSSLAETAGLTLDDPDGAYKQLLARSFVVPGDPSSSPRDSSRDGWYGPDPVQGPFGIK